MAHVTMRKSVLDSRAPGVRLLTYGMAEFERLLDTAGIPIVALDNGNFPFQGKAITTLADLDSGELRKPGGS